MAKITCFNLPSAILPSVVENTLCYLGVQSRNLDTGTPDCSRQVDHALVRLAELQQAVFSCNCCAFSYHLLYTVEEADGLEAKWRLMQAAIGVATSQRERDGGRDGKR